MQILPCGLCLWRRLIRLHRLDRDEKEEILLVMVVVVEEGEEVKLSRSIPIS